MTQQDLAEKASLDVRVVSAYENDKRRPRAQTLRRLVAALGGTPLPKETGRRGASEAPRPPRTSADCGGRAGPEGEGEVIVAHDAEMIVVWTGNNGGLSAIAAGH